MIALVAVLALSLSAQPVLPARSATASIPREILLAANAEPGTVTMSALEYEALREDAAQVPKLEKSLDAAVKAIADRDAVLLWHNAKLHELASAVEDSPPLEDVVIYACGIAGGIAVGIGVGAELSGGDGITEPAPAMLDIIGGLAAGLALLRALGSL